MKPQLAEVHTLFETNAADIAAMARQTADNVEAETDENDRTKSIIAVQFTESGALKIYAWGRSDSMEAQAILGLALYDLQHSHFVRTQEND